MPSNPYPPVVSKFLAAATRMPRKRDKTGDCYEAAGKYMLDQCLRGCENLRLVHAEVLGQGSLQGVTYGHAFVIDRSNGRNIRMPKDIYYLIGRINKLDNIHEYTYQEMGQRMLETGIWGPWDLKTRTGL